MKERSKNAARTRREKENFEFSELAKLLPLPHTVTAQLDKASIIRLASSYLKMRNLFPKGLGDEWGGGISPCFYQSDGYILKELSTHLLQSLDGFVFVLADDAKIIYVSETASVHLGLPQVELTGNSIYDYIHELDCEEVKSLMKHEEAVPPQKFPNEDIEIPKSFCLRMKCVLAKRNAGLAYDGYKVIHCNGYLKLRCSLDTSSEDATMTNYRYQVAGLVAVGHSLPSTVITDIKMSSHTFMFRAGLDFHLLYLDPRIQPLTGYEAAHLMGKSLYQFVHPEDCPTLSQDHAKFLNKGQVVTSYYRLLTRCGGWIWIQSYCTIIHYNRNSRNRRVLFLNHILSERDYAKTLVAEVQIQPLKVPNYNQSDNGTAAKRPRHPQQTVNIGMSQLNNEPSAINPSLTRTNVQPSNSPVVQCANIFPNAVSSHPSLFYKNDQEALQLQSEIFQFEQIMKAYQMGDGNGRLFQSNTASTSNAAYHNPQNVFHHFNTSPFVDTAVEQTVEQSPPNYEPFKSPIMYQKPSLNYKLGVPQGAPIDNSGSFSEMSRCMYTQNANIKYLSSHDDAKCVKDDEKLSYYVEHISTNSSNPIEENEDTPKHSWSPTPSKNNRDVNCDILNPTRSKEQETHNSVENCRYSTCDDVRSDPYFFKSLNSGNGEYKMDDGLQYLFASELPDQPVSFGICKSSDDIRFSPSGSKYINMVNCIPNAKQTLIQKATNFLVSANDKAYNLSPLSNHLDYQTSKVISPPNISFEISKESSVNLSPLSLCNEMPTVREPINEQSHYFKHCLLQNQNGFLGYANQYAFPSPVTPDSLCDTKCRGSSDSLSDNI